MLNDVVAGMVLNLGGFKELVAAIFADKPSLLVSRAAGQCGNLEDIAGQRPILVAVVNGCSSVSAVSAFGFSSGFANAAMIGGSVGFADSVYVEVGSLIFP